MVVLHTAEQEGEGEWFFNVNEVLGRPIGEHDNGAVPNIADVSSTLPPVSLSSAS